MLGTRLHEVAFGMARIASQALDEKGGLTFAQFKLLQAANRMPDCSQNKIAKFGHISEAAVSRLIDTVVGKGWLIRGDNQENRREHVLRLTAEGRSQMTEAGKVVDKKMALVFDGLSRDERESLGKILGKLKILIYENH